MSKIDPIQSLFDYVSDIKPYHTKVLDVFVTYRKDDLVGLRITDAMMLSIEANLNDSNQACEFAGFDIGNFDDGWNSASLMKDITVAEINPFGGYFSIAGDYRGFFAARMVDALPGLYHVQVNSPLQTFTLIDVNYDSILNRTLLSVVESLGSMSGGTVSVPLDSNWDFPLTCINPATGSSVATSHNVVSTFSEALTVRDADIVIADIVPVGRFNCDTAIGWGGLDGYLREQIISVDAISKKFEIYGNWTAYLALNPSIVVHNPLFTFTNDVVNTVYDAYTNITHVFVAVPGGITGIPIQANLNTLQSNFASAYIIVQATSQFSDPSFQTSDDVYDGDCGWDWQGSNIVTETLFKEGLQITAADGDATQIVGSWDGNRWDMTLFNGNTSDYFPQFEQF